MKTMFKPGLVSDSWSCFFLFILFISSVQVSFSQKTLSTSGGVASNDLYNLEFSLGQVFYEMESNTGYQSCEGVLRSEIESKKRKMYFSRFDVYPNPSKENFKVNFENPERIKKVSIRNSQGILLKEYFNGFDYLECSLKSAPGVYFIIVTSHSDETTKTLIKL